MILICTVKSYYISVKIVIVDENNSTLVLREE